MTKIRTATAALLLFSLASVPGPASAQDACMSRGEGRELVAEGQVIPFPDALQQAGIAAEQVVDVQLCESGGGFVYRVRVLQPNGRVRATNIPAG